MMVGVQARDKPDMRSAMENNVATVACLLLQVPIFLSLAWTQVLDKPDAWTLVTVGLQARDAPDLWRSAPKNDAKKATFLLLQGPVFLLLAGARMHPPIFLSFFFPSFFPSFLTTYSTLVPSHPQPQQVSLPDTQIPLRTPPPRIVLLQIGIRWLSHDDDGAVTCLGGFIKY